MSLVKVHKNEGAGFKNKENHRRAAIYALTHEKTLNSSIEEAVEARLNALNA